MMVLLVLMTTKTMLMIKNVMRMIDKTIMKTMFDDAEGNDDRGCGNRNETMVRARAMMGTMMTTMMMTITAAMVVVVVMTMVSVKMSRMITATLIATMAATRIIPVTLLYMWLSP